MNVKIKLYSDEMEKLYINFLNSSNNSMFYHCLSYRKFLKEIFSDCEDYYICAFIGNEIFAVLPVFVKPGKFGNIINSLPFFGSHGGIIYRGDKINKFCEMSLLKYLEKLCKVKKVFSCTIIGTPFEKDQLIYKLFNPNLHDDRIGQITKLPICDDKIKCEESLFKLFHSKTRNSIRKGLKSNFKIICDNSLQSFENLYRLHKKNMEYIGGKAKKKDIFDTIFRVFKPNDEFNIYSALYDGVTISAILLFYHKGTVEYFCPATDLNFKNKQPLSVLIYKAMMDSVLNKKSLLWNWGGTWSTQKGVYFFKSRWGSSDYPYKYYIKTFFNFKKNQYSASQLNESYENFYSLPFSLCKN